MQEVGDLKERLLMGQDEYKTQFVECARMKRELNRMQKSGTFSSIQYSHVNLCTCMSVCALVDCLLTSTVSKL